MHLNRHHSVVAAIAMLGVLMAGCASKPTRPAPSAGYVANGAVSAEVVDQSSAEHYQVASGVSYLGSAPARNNPEPTYPASLLARLLQPITVVVRVVVGGAGTVSNASVVSSTSLEPDFADAVLAAVGAWTFDPLKRITDGKTEALPFTQEYRFTFRQVDGHAVVETSGTAKR